MEQMYYFVVWSLSIEHVSNKGNYLILSET